MAKFEAKRLMSKSSNLAATLVRGAACLLPTIFALGHGVETGMAAAVGLGLADGWSRLWTARSASSFTAESAGLRITSGLASRLVPWSGVRAIQTWRRSNRVAYVVVHYRTEIGINVASCWEQDGSDDMEDFVRASASWVRAALPARHSATLASLGDAAIWGGLARRSVLGIVAALVLGRILGVWQQAYLLGVVAALVSTSVECTRYHVRTRTFNLKGGVWSRAGSTEALGVLPPSLQRWLTSLASVPSLPSTEQAEGAVWVADV